MIFSKVYSERTRYIFLDYPHVIQEDSPLESCSPYDYVKPAPKPKPWTRKPSCLKSGDNETYCVYTNEKFANGRGISFFTSPSIAEKVTQLPAFTKEGLHDEANNFEDPPWEIRNVRGRGNGLFATRTLHRGDLILADTPLGVYQSDAFFPDYELGYQYLRKSFEQLPKSSQEIFLQTGTHSPGDKVMERINTNAFAGDFEGEPHFLLYPETALMNHDCRPKYVSSFDQRQFADRSSAMYYHDPMSLIHSSHASRTIQPGEEITITCKFIALILTRLPTPPDINLLQPQSQRQEVLSQIWGFTCTCSLCKSSDSDISDGHVSRIIELFTLLADWSPASTATPKLAEELLILCKEEKLYAAFGSGHFFAAQAYNAAGVPKMAAWHAQKAVEMGIVGDDDAEGQVVQMKELMKNPRGHWTFGVRKKK
ncbi:hypothetical protein LSUE1_G007473 [Lachnellula suecica]|uniref:SET domain-containing protein n=1 Tax=Lachnellula suecica TaxID=602035 RepID=A0A8T9C5S6_9HELO|nr:hypothetical protein LSUE1_G007473 [Lachnellula suecica]